MPISDKSWSGEIREISYLERQDHHHLTADDACAFMGEYTANKSYSHSTTNGLVWNLKKGVEKRNTWEWPHKVRAIRDAAAALRANLEPGSLANDTFVPMPGSKTPACADYDDRMHQVVRALGRGVDLRPILFTRVRRDAFHANTGRRDKAALKATIGVRNDLCAPVPGRVVLVDDVLTTGCTFSVCKQIIGEIWPDAAVFGLFIARRAIDRTAEFDLLDDIDF